MASAIAQLGHLELREHPEKGRAVYVVAPEGIPAGTTLFEEIPFGSVVLTSSSQKLCGRCFQDADPDIVCDDCTEVMFCSDKCQRAIGSIHELECETLENIDLIAKKSKADRDLLRLLIRILCIRAIERPEVESHTIRSTYDDVQAMIHATAEMGPDWIRSVEHGAELLLKSLPKQCNVPVAEVVGLAARVNENSYSLDPLSTKAPLGVVSVGLFPLSGLINHSCKPNTVWSTAASSKSGALVMRAIEFIPYGHEVTVTYIDVNQPRPKRRAELLDTKHFFCQCSRCTAPIEDSVDAIVDGVCCPPPCSGLLHLSTSGQYKCLACGKEQNIDFVDQLKTEASSRLKYAQDQYNKKNYQDAKDILSSLLEKHDASSTSFSLHPSNSTQTTALQVLADCCFKLGQYKESYLHHQDVLQRLEKTLQKHAPALATSYLDLATSIGILLKHDPWTQDKASLENEMKISYEKCFTIRSICYEPSHPSVQIVRKALDAKF